MSSESYPDRSDQRSSWIQDRRSARHSVDPTRPYHFLLEEEPDGNGQLDSVATIFLTNRECPWQCVMCDLWKNTLESPLSPGAIPKQMDHALNAMGLADLTQEEKSSNRHLKLYNSGSFFDVKAIPPEDYADIVLRCRGFKRVVVECHPALVNQRVAEFREMLYATTQGQLEVAMGLECADSVILDKLNKRMTLDDFARASQFLREHQVSLRVFVLVQPPFSQPEQAVELARQAVDFAFDNGAETVSLIPTRLGNGALEELREQGQFSEPDLQTLEQAFDYAMGTRQGRVLVDLWDLHRFSNCESCWADRQKRLFRMNLTQTAMPPVTCGSCSGS